MTIHITWFQWNPATVLQIIGNNYTAHVNPNVKIVVDAVPISQWYSNNFNQFAAHKTSFAAGILDSQWIGNAVADHDILDLTSWLKANLNTNDYYPYLFAAYSQYPQRQPGVTGGLNLSNGHFYGIPWESDVQVFAYRKDLWAEPANQKAFMAKYHYPLAVPKSMDQIVDMADFFTNAGKSFYGIGVHEMTGYDAAAETFNPWCWNYGGDIWNAKTAQVWGYINSPRCVHALTLVDHVTQKDSPPGSGSYFIPDVNTAICQNKVAMIEQWWGGTPALVDPKSCPLGKTKADLVNKIGYFAFPGETYMGVHSQWAPLGGMGLSISAYAPKDQQDAALAFAKWFQSPDTQKTWYELGGGPTSKTILNSAAFLAAYPSNPVASQSFHIIRDFWNMPEYNPMLNALNSTINQSMTGGIAPQAALDSIARKQAAILRNSGNYPYYNSHTL